MENPRETEGFRISIGASARSATRRLLRLHDSCAEAAARHSRLGTNGDSATIRRSASARAASREERLDLLAELIRLDPIVGRLYRRVVETIPAGDEDDGCPDLQPDDLIEIVVDAVNTDPDAVGACPYAVDPERELAAGVDRAGWSFGDGAHRCPGRHLALLQTEALLSRLVDLDARIVRPPRIVHDSLLAGIGVRDLVVRWP